MSKLKKKENEQKAVKQFEELVEHYRKKIGEN